MIKDKYNNKSMINPYINKIFNNKSKKSKIMK